MELAKIGAVLALALVFMLVNMKAGQNWLRLLTVTGLVGALGLASWLVVDWVLLT